MRCPFRIAAFDRDESCDPRCAWLMRDRGNYKVCAIAVIAMQVGERRIFVPENEIQVSE